MHPHTETIPTKAWNRDSAAVGLAILYVIVFSLLSIGRHEGLRTQMNDLGNMVQAIWGASQGDLCMLVTNDPDGEIRSRLGVHGNLIFYFLALPFLILPPLIEHMEVILLILGSLACGLTGLGIYFIAKSQLTGDRFHPLLIALAFWCNPVVHDANLYDFHTTTIVSAFLVWMLWAWMEQRNALGWILFGLAISCKEDVAPILLMLGVGKYILGEKLRGGRMIYSSIIYLVILFGVIIPAANFGHPVPKIVSSRLEWLGDGPSEYLKTIFFSPLTVAEHVFAYERIRLPVYLLLLGGILCFGKGFWVAIGVIPAVAVALLTQGDWMTRLTGTYYWAPTVALIYVGCIVSFKSTEKPNARWFGVAYLLSVSVILSILLSQAPWGILTQLDHFAADELNQRCIQEVKRMIPDTAGVSAQNNIAAQLAKRKVVAIFPSQSESADFLVFQLRYQHGPDPTMFPSYSRAHIFRTRPTEFLARIDKIRQSKDWSLCYRNAGFIAFKRIRADEARNVMDGESWATEREAFFNSIEEDPPLGMRRIYELLGYSYRP